MSADDVEVVELPGSPPAPVRVWTRETARARVVGLRRILDRDGSTPTLRVDPTWRGGTAVRVWCDVHEGTARTEAEALSEMVDDAEEAARSRLAQLLAVIERHRRKAAEHAEEAAAAATERAALTVALAGGQMTLPGGAR